MEFQRKMVSLINTIYPDGSIPVSASLNMSYLPGDIFEQFNIHKVPSNSSCLIIPCDVNFLDDETYKITNFYETMILLPGDRIKNIDNPAEPKDSLVA